MAEVWKRPGNLPFPAVYDKFVASNLDSTKLVQYKVQDIPEEKYEEACRFMVKHFVPTEPKLASKNGENDPLVLEDYFNKCMHSIKQKVSIACFQRGSDELVGVNIMQVLGKNDKSNKCEMKSKICKDIQAAIEYVLEKADIFNRYKVDYYLSGTGLAIDPAFTGKGIATEMIRARAPMLEFLGLEVSSTGFSSIAAQKAALKAGYETDYGISYEELAKINSDWNFSGTTTKTYEQMTLTLEKCEELQ